MNGQFMAPDGTAINVAEQSDDWVKARIIDAADNIEMQNNSIKALREILAGRAQAMAAMNEARKVVAPSVIPTSQPVSPGVPVPEAPAEVSAPQVPVIEQETEDAPSE